MLAVEGRQNLRVVLVVQMEAHKEERLKEESEEASHLTRLKCKSDNDMKLISYNLYGENIVFIEYF